MGAQEEARSSLAVHPALTMCGVFADQVRIDEIRLRAGGALHLEPKRLELLRDLAGGVAKMMNVAICDASFTKDGGGYSLAPLPYRQFGEAGSAQQSDDDSD